MAKEIAIVEVLCERCVQAAWNWLLENSNPRPDDPYDVHIWHFRVWAENCNLIEVELSEKAPMMLSRLFLTSQLGEVKGIVDLVSEKGSFPIFTFLPFDADISAVLKDKRRFRHALSEILSFWIHMVVIANMYGVTNFSSTLPNLQPEDKGPDGLSFIIREDVSQVEIHSVKSSIGNPRQLIASGAFRNGGKPQSGKLLDDFYQLEKNNVGFHRLDRMLANVYKSMDLTSDQILRMGLLIESKYNGVIVADDKHSNSDDFNGFERVRNSPHERIATYISSHCWELLAEKTRESTNDLLRECGIL